MDRKRRSMGLRDLGPGPKPITQGPSGGLLQGILNPRSLVPGTRLTCSRRVNTLDASNQ